MRDVREWLARVQAGVSPEERRFRVETLPTVLNAPMIGLFFYLILSNQANWAVINGVAESIFHFGAVFGPGFNYMVFLLALLGGFGAYCIIYFILSLARLDMLHKPLLNMFPIAFITVMVAVFVVVFNINQRLDYSFLYFFLGIQNGLIMYMALTLGTFVIVVMLVAGLPPLWSQKSISAGRYAGKPLHGKFLTITTLYGSGMIIPVMLLFVIYAPPTIIYWENITVVQSRFLAWQDPFVVGWIALFVASIALLVLIALPFSKGRGFSIRGTMVARKHLIVALAIDLGVQLALLVAIAGAIDAGTGVASSVGFYVVLGLSACTYALAVAFLVLLLSRSAIHVVDNLKPVAKGASKMALLCGLILPVFWITFYQPLVVNVPSGDVQLPMQVVDLNGIHVPFSGSDVYPDFSLQPPWSREYMNLSGPWRVHYASPSTLDSLGPRSGRFLDRIETGEQALGYDDAGWTVVGIPTSLANFTMPDGHVQVEFIEPGMAYGIAWLRKNVTVPGTWANRSISLRFLAVNHIADTWIDGHHVGYHEGTDRPFGFDVTDFMAPGEHVIAVRVDYPFNDPRFARKIIPAGGDFFAFMGIVRDVYLESAPVAAIRRVDMRVTSLDTLDHLRGTVMADVDVTLQVPESLLDSRASLSIGCYPLWFPSVDDLGSLQTWQFANWSHPAIIPVSRNVTLEGMNGTRYTACRLSIDLANVSLWSTKRPNLYALVVNLTPSDTMLGTDSYVVQAGFRTIEVSGTELLLNGAPVKLAGITYSEQRYYPTFKNLSPSQYLSDFLLINSTRANYLRTGFLKPSGYLIADRFGFLVWEEGPLGWANDINFFMAFSRNMVDAMWTEICYEVYNNPSVIFYGICNEPWSAIGLHRYLPHLRAFLGNLDPCRLVSFTAASSQTWNPAFDYLQSVTPNIYGGTFEGVKFAWDDEISKACHAWSEANPGKPVVVMEWGYWREADWRWGPEKGWAWYDNDTRQRECFEEGYLAFTNASESYVDAVQGFVWFSGFDYYTSNYYNAMGIWDIDRVLRSSSVLGAMQTYYAGYTMPNL